MIDVPVKYLSRTWINDDKGLTSQSIFFGCTCTWIEYVVATLFRGIICTCTSLLGSTSPHTLVLIKKKDKEIFKEECR